MVLGLLVGFVLLARQARWDGKEQQIFLLVLPPTSTQEVLRSIQILIVRPKESTAMLFPLPENLYIEALQGYGLYKSSALFGLADLEHMSEQFVRRSLALSLGIDIQHTIWDSRISSSSSVNALRAIAFRSLRMQNKSTSAFIERYRLWRVLSNMRQDQLAVIDPVSSQMFVPITAAGDTQALGIDILKLDEVVFRLFANPSLRKEQVSVSIVNTTHTTGMATKIARALTSMGVDIVHISSDASPIEHSVIYSASKSLQNSVAAGTIQRTLNIEGKRFQWDEQKAQEYRADLVLMLGEDVASLFVKKN